MERTIAVFHEGALAHYNVAKQPDGSFKARLLQYSGQHTSVPPQVVHLQKHGHHWSQHENLYDNLVEELGTVIQIEHNRWEEPVYSISDWAVRG